MKSRTLSSLLIVSSLCGCSLLRVQTDPSSTTEKRPTGGENRDPKNESELSERVKESDGPENASPSKEAPPAIDVVQRLQGFTREDSYELARVAEALKNVTPEMVRFTPDTKAEMFSWAPSDAFSSVRGANNRKFGAKECKSHGFMIRAGYQRVLEEAVCDADESFQRLPANTPVVVWSREDGGSAILVTFDGGRYVGRESTLLTKPSGPPVDAPLQHTFLGVQEIKGIAKHDDQAKTAAEATTALAKDYNSCNYKLFDAGQKEITAMLAASGPMSASQEKAKISIILTKNEKQQERTCDKFLGELEKALVSFTDERNATRKKLWEETASVRALSGK